MDNRQLHPLKVNPKTGEPFLQLPSPLEHIIITPLRLADKPAIIENLNDERVHQRLAGPPYPYLQEHADWWVDKYKRRSDEILRELEEEHKRNPDGPLKIVESCPVRSIREVKDDGTDMFLGDIDCYRCNYEELNETTEEEKTKKNSLVDANAAKQTGDPSIIWTFGNYLAASHHRQGIMTAVVAALLKAWIVPRCNARVIRAYILVGNHGSVKVFQNNGFKLKATLEACKEVKGKIRGLNILEWRLEDQ